MSLGGSRATEMNRKRANMDAPEVFEQICGRLEERRVSLFLGAGINADVQSSDGEKFPLGSDLAQMLCRDILGDIELPLTLDEASEYCRQKVGASELNRYLYEVLTSFEPGRSHQLLTCLPWDTIYTTNYDLLLERACEENPGQLGTLQIITSVEEDLSAFSEEDTLYYKLHGSIDLANSKAGRLILTQEDYRTYEQLRRPLFRRLGTDIQSRTFVFAGYQLRDPNFRQVLEDCRSAVDSGVLPLSYAIRPGHRPAEAEFWQDKYNLRLLDCTAEEFLDALVGTWQGSAFKVKPLEERALYGLVSADEATSFPKVADCYYRVLPDRCTGASSPTEFFRGAEATWADIRDEIAPPREAMWALLEAMFDELDNPELPATAYLLNGHAGTGKTHVAQSLLYLIARDFGKPVVVHIPGTPLAVDDLRSLIESNPGDRVVVLVQDGAELCEELARFHKRAFRSKLPVTLIIEERTNQWETAMQRCHSRFTPEGFGLGRLSSREVGNVLDALTENGALGALEGSDRATQIEHFDSVAHKELLVALREITSGQKFDEIVVDEFNSIPSDLAKEAYEYVAAVGRVDLFIRYNTLAHLLNCGFEVLGQAVFKQTEGVLLSSKFVGRSRHTIGYKLRVRHPVIASIVFEAAAPTDKNKYDILSYIIESLDCGFVEDRSLLEELVRRRDIVGTFEHEDYKRAIYERLAEALPNSAYVAQHRSLLERDLGDDDAAVRFAREAVRLNPGNRSIKTTLGFALASASRTQPESTTSKAMFLEATSLFEAEASSAHSSGYGHLGLAQLRRQEFEAESDPDKKQELKIRALAFLEAAREEIDRPELVDGEIAKLKSELGNRAEAIRMLRTSLSGDPTDTRVRGLLLKFLVDASEFGDALRIAQEGVKHAPTDWRLRRHMARLLGQEGASVNAVREHYDAAIRSNRGSVQLLVELGGFLFSRGEYGEANTCFTQAGDMAQSTAEKRRVTSWWRDESGRKRKFAGEVASISGGVAFARAIPEGFEAFFWRGPGIHDDLEAGDAIEFIVGFNARGPRATVTRRR